MYLSVKSVLIVELFSFKHAMWRHIFLYVTIVTSYFPKNHLAIGASWYESDKF